jgi:hypothetical protein
MYFYFLSARRIKFVRGPYAACHLVNHGIDIDYFKFKNLLIKNNEITILTFL